MKVLSIFIALLASLLCSALVAEEALPETEIFLLQLNKRDAEPVNISLHDGYDNQPAFSTDGNRIYYSRSDNGQTDIWYYDIRDDKRVQLSETPESEYSPQLPPHKNSLSLVRVEMDGTQTFSLMNINTRQFQNLAPELTTVGYYCWFSQGSAALFLLPEPFELRLYANKEEQLKVADNIGRALAKNPLNGDLLYVDKSSAPWKITAFKPSSPDKKVIAKMFPKQEDFIVSSSGKLWTALGGKLYSRNLADKHWKLEFDLRAYQIEKISRLAISNDETRLALVNTVSSIK